MDILYRRNVSWLWNSLTGNAIETNREKHTDTLYHVRANLTEQQREAIGRHLEQSKSSDSSLEFLLPITAKTDEEVEVLNAMLRAVSLYEARQRSIALYVVSGGLAAVSALLTALYKFPPLFWLPLALIVAYEFRGWRWVAVIGAGLAGIGIVLHVFGHPWLWTPAAGMVLGGLLRWALYRPLPAVAPSVTLVEQMIREKPEERYSQFVKFTLGWSEADRWRLLGQTSDPVLQQLLVRQLEEAGHSQHQIFLFLQQTHGADR